MDGQIDAICDQFESRLKSGRNPWIEGFLVGWEEPELSRLLYELLLLEIEHLSRNGKMADKGDYYARFPKCRHVVDEAFGRPRTSEDTVVANDSGETLVLKSTLGNLNFHDQGGLGVVYLAKDQQLKRETAVKFIHDRLAGDPDSRDRFLLEAEITSRLEHPGVVPVYGLGHAKGGRLFYAMRFIHGESLEAAIRRYYEPSEEDAVTRNRQVQFHELLSRFVAVCRTIAYAHNRGIVHRDIKPQNVMLGRYGETIVIDWGLAIPVDRAEPFKETGEKTLMPSSGSQQSGEEGPGAGTPAYMSPEQADGRVALGPHSDIYSLGVVLYKILTGKLPFGGNSVNEVKRNVIDNAFQRPTHVARGVSKALEAICLKAMSPNAQNRYATALELAKDIDRYLADAPVLAYQEPVLRRLARWNRRHRTVAQSMLASLVLLTVVGLFATFWQSRQKRLVERALRDVEVARKSENDLRLKGLVVSARFAARTIANQIDIRWRILEKEAADPELCQLVSEANRDPRDRQLQQSVQDWIDARVEALYDGIQGRTRSWAIQSIDGTQVARYPSIKEDGTRYPSIGENFAFRDYFHGDGEDIPKKRAIAVEPLTNVHNSAAMRSTNGGDLMVMLSVPIRPDPEEPVIGVLGMSIELGSFADLEIPLPEGQGVLLVETRGYRMLKKDDINSRSDEDFGRGLLLHHEGLREIMATKPGKLPHIGLSIRDHMRNVIRRVQENGGKATWADCRLPSEYKDPLAGNESDRWLAAFAAVQITGRSPDPLDTGWFVIVQQKEQEPTASVE